MIFLVMLWAGIATVVTGSKLIDEPHPTVSQYVVFGVAAAFTLVSLILHALTGDDE